MKGTHRARRCTAETRHGLPCRAWAVRGSNPLLCAAHGGEPATVSDLRPLVPAGGDLAGVDRPVDRYADPGPQAGLDPRAGGGADLDAVIADLERRRRQLSDYIDDHKDEMRPGQYITACDYEGRLSSRIGRLLRDRQQLQGEHANELDQAVAEALAIVGEAWGIALTPPPADQDLTGL